MQEDSLPKHVALIIDGNRRWAKENNLPYWKGHEKGAERVEEVLREALDIGIEYLTIWGGSYNNLTKRTPKEIQFLDEKMYRVWAKKLVDDKDIHEHQVRVRFIGEWPDLLSKETIEAIHKAQEATKDYSKHNVTYLIGYNGDREMLAAINSLNVDGVAEEDLVNALWTRELPPVDIVIRTGGDPHLSTGFMMWHTKDALLHFDEKKWPAFTKDSFREVIKAFSERERRYGK